jgi:hypothetical protein
MRHLKLSSVEDIGKPVVQRLIKAALKDRRANLPK